MNKTEMKDFILNQIEKPRIPSVEYRVSHFGAVADSSQIQTTVLQKAIDTVSELGGGKLILQEGCYRTGALWMKSRVELHLESKKTVLSFVHENPAENYPLVFSHWEASPCYNFSPLIYACDAHDIAVTGDGILDGGADAEHWWNWHHQVEEAWSSNQKDLQLEDRKTLRNMNHDGVPVEERIFGAGHYLRPNFIQPIRCERVLLEGFTLKNSPMWQLNPVMCKSLIIDSVTMSSHGANNDGCDPESCDGVWIHNCCFDTGDDCISLKSGRDRDGREANIPCQNILIEDNDFADGHGGVALGSEMSGGIFKVVAVNNRFSSPNLTYALRLKTNARRGGIVEDIILADSVMDHVKGAAVHGTMLYEDGRNGNHLPAFRNITIENITAHGGDYGIFLEAFAEVPITGLVLRNICIDGAEKTLHGMNWENPVIENVTINGLTFPRPVKVRIKGIPEKGNVLTAVSESCSQETIVDYQWKSSDDGEVWKDQNIGNTYLVTGKERYIKVVAEDEKKNQVESHIYQVTTDCKKSDSAKRLICRNMLNQDCGDQKETLLTRQRLAEMIVPLTDCEGDFVDASPEQILSYMIKHGFLGKENKDEDDPKGNVTRQEMASVAMQTCGINYKNASSTMPVCCDVKLVGNNYGTNVARALYFGFMSLNQEGCFEPECLVNMEEAVTILNRVADFAGL